MARRKKNVSYAAEMGSRMRPVKRAFKLPLPGRKEEVSPDNDIESVSEEDSEQDSEPEEVSGNESSFEEAPSNEASLNEKPQAPAEEAAPVKETTPEKADENVQPMPDFLKSANSTIRRDGPYKNYSGSADVLRHKRRENDNKRGRRRGLRKKQKRESVISPETISLIALVVIIGTIFFCAIKHVEMRELSLAALIVTSLITVIMGLLLGDAPSYVALILVALIIIAGAVTGMFSEVITGSVIFLGAVSAVKGRFE